MTKNKPRGLGRGLSALMADVGPVTNEKTNSGGKTPDIVVPIEKVIPNPDQPRRQFNPEDLQDLTASIKTKGIIQPLIVRPRDGDTYEIVAGERRWRAAQAAQLHEVPVLVRDFSDVEVLEVAVIENVQRADLNAIEEAIAYQQLMNNFGHTQEKVAEALGKSRSHIANLTRLLNLPQEVQDYVQDGKLSAGHARALITSDNPITIAHEIARKGLSVRQTEAMVRKFAQGDKEDKPKPAKSSGKDADTAALEADLSAALKMKVSLAHPPGQEGGQLTIRYKTLEELDNLCRVLGGG